MRDNLRVNGVTLDAKSGVRWIVCHNPVEAERDPARRTETLTRLTAVGDAERRRAGEKVPSEQVHVKAECPCATTPPWPDFRR